MGNGLLFSGDTAATKPTVTEVEKTVNGESVNTKLQLSIARDRLEGAKRIYDSRLREIARAEKALEHAKSMSYASRVEFEMWDAEVNRLEKELKVDV